MATFGPGNGYGQRPPPSGGGGRGNPAGNSNLMRGRGDDGDSPAFLPLGSSGSPLDIRADSVASSLTSPSQEERRREERRSKRAAARETKRSMIEGPGLRTSTGLAPGDPMPDFDEPDENYHLPVMPGSFAVAGPGAREAQQRASVKGKPAAVYEDHDNLLEGGGAGDDEKTNQNLPVAFEAEVVFDYPNHDVVVAQKDEGRRTVPLHWLIIVGCLMFIAAVAVSVSLGIVLGGKEEPSSSASSLVVEPTFSPVVAPTFPPVDAPTFTPVVPPTFAPVVPPTFTPVVPPSYPPQDGPTPPPQPPPTFAPVVPPTFTPVVPPTFAPVPWPTKPNASPTSSPPVATNPPSVVQTVVSPVQPGTTTVAPTILVAPTNPPATPTNPPVAPTNPPTDTPVVAPTDPPTDPPVEAPTESSNNPVYTGSDGMPCKCRYYTEDILVSSTDDYRTLSSGELNAYVQAMLAIVDDFNPYSFRRKLVSSRWTLRARILQPSSINYAFEVEGQTLIGTAGTDPFGVRTKFYYEFCVDDESYIDDYHDAFLQYMQNGSNREPIASQIRNAGLSSLTEISTPSETGEFCG